MDAHAPVPERPTECPKGHDLWFFTSRHELYWAICGGCPHVWVWPGKSGALAPCYQFNREVLVECLRGYGMQEGHFPHLAATRKRRMQARVDIRT